ncbi:LysR family transcriptional regulator [Bradyrhizobium sp. BR13661]|jgi:DNA-binding transcriptional LysR family regulator|uniref:LysR family transcriptional regulator n=1 Tax=Bradyrhizobium sp. BR13661 TaxID=2940622 RepID=UPI002475061E|nr:LysR family transcriptional regulator [Bradyrhizobium sp. BR13661]MDH6264287.1 DNA-binding transcriptional LysR family regulator [Bradyrhizobium sp. BR13661]
MNRPYVLRMHAVDLKHLRSAVAAADYGSIRQAAELLSIRHSILSRSICELEHRIGVRVFERSGGGVKPTPAGRSVLRVARLVLEQVDVLVATAKSNGRGEAGRLSVGFCTSISAGNLRATLTEFKKRFPQIELATIERSRTRLASALRNGTADILVVTGNVPLPDNDVRALWSERILVSLPENHALAARSVVYWTDLRNETVLLSQYDPGREFEDLMISKLVSVTERPKIERHDVSRGIIKSLISMNIGISMVLESDIGASFAGLVYRELNDGTGPSRLDFYAYWRDDNENPVLKHFVDLLAERYPSPPPAFGK